MLGLHPVVLKPQDVALALKILVLENRPQAPSASIGDSRPDSEHYKPSREKLWTLAQLAKETHLSIGEVHNALHRLVIVRLVRSEGRRLNRYGLEEFLTHGIRYVFPAATGTATRGLPTAYAAPMLQAKFLFSGQELPVWPYANGTVRGMAFSPLYTAAPDAALEDPNYYELLALADALRGEVRARERAAATELLRSHLAVRFVTE